MRKIYILALLALSAISCSKILKDPETMLKFSIDGILYEIPHDFTRDATGSQIRKADAGSGFHLESISPTFNDGLDVQFDAVAVGTNNGREAILTAMPYVYEFRTPGDFFTIQITKVKRGYVDGIFTAQLTSRTTPKRVIINDGVFTNVKIRE